MNATPTRSVEADLSDLLGDTETKAPGTGVEAVKTAAQKAVKIATKKPVAKKPVVTPIGKKPTLIVSRGAVVKPGLKNPVSKTPTPRRAAVPYTDTMKIKVIEGARNYVKGGNVEKAVLIMKKAVTVGKYNAMMNESGNPLPPIGLLRHLDKKRCVNVG